MSGVETMHTQVHSHIRCMRRALLTGAMRDRWRLR